jgi:hypothetical protein
LLWLGLDGEGLIANPSTFDGKPTEYKNFKQGLLAHFQFIKANFWRTMKEMSKNNSSYSPK